MASPLLILPYLSDIPVHPGIPASRHPDRHARHYIKSPEAAARTSLRETGFGSETAIFRYPKKHTRA